MSEHFNASYMFIGVFKQKKWNKYKTTHSILVNNMWTANCKFISFSLIAKPSRLLLKEWQLHCFAYGLLVIINRRTCKIYIHYSFDLLQTLFCLVVVSLRQTWQQGFAGMQCCRQPAETHLHRDPANKPHKLESKMFLDRTRHIFTCLSARASEWTFHFRDESF